jgi:hypothetical protein
MLFPVRMIHAQNSFIETNLSTAEIPLLAVPIDRLQIAFLPMLAFPELFTVVTGTL